MQIVLNDKLVTLLNTGFHLQPEAYKNSIFTWSRTVEQGSSNLPFKMMQS